MQSTIPINHAPFAMEAISEQLFNLPFLADVTFIVDGKQIYAHTLELMKRSSVFQQQFEHISDAKRCVPIADYRYDSFYQFIRFIYTDNCDITYHNCFELMKLAKAYNVTRFVNVVQNSKYFSYDDLRMLDFCVMAKHQVPLNHAKIKVALNLNTYLMSGALQTVRIDTIKEILKFDQISTDMTEMSLLDGLIGWMDNYCVQHNLHRSECQEQFHELVRLIRFPTLSIEELKYIKTKYPDLLAESDFLNIAGQKVFGIDVHNPIWNHMARKEATYPYEIEAFSCNNYFETKFCVSFEMILCGFVFGSRAEFCLNYDYINVKISSKDPNWDEASVIVNMNLKKSDVFWNSVVISLDSSVRVRPNCTYIVGYKFIGGSLTPEDKIHLYCRKTKSKLIVSAPKNSVVFYESHKSMYEMLLVKPADYQF